MAIALDATSSADAKTVSHTCTGSNRFLVVGIETSNAGTANDADYVSAVTYNGVAMTRATTGGTADYRLYIYYLVAPATGANTISVTSSAAVNKIRNASYTGVKQGAQPDALGAFVSAATPITIATTLVLDNCWTVGPARASNAIVADSGCVVRVTGATGLVDSNAALASGTRNMVVSTSSGGVGGIAISFSPVLTFTVAVTDTCTQTENALKRSRSYPAEIVTLTQISIKSVSDTLGLSEAYFNIKLLWKNLAKNTATFTNAVKNPSTFTNLSKNISSWINQSKN